MLNCFLRTYFPSFKLMVFILVFLLNGIYVSSQTLVSSNVGVRTCLNNNECSSANSSSYLFYDESRNEFYLKVDFNKLKVGVDSLDYWLNDLSDSYLYFNAHIQKEEFPSLSNSNSKTFTVNGQLFLNNVWHNQSVDISVFSTENSSLNYSQSANKYSAYKVNFGFSVIPKDFKINKKEHHLTNTIFISVGMGQINMLVPGMESFLSEAYAHQ